MISSIERGDYIPNAAMFISLCERLGISLDAAFLKTKLSLGKAQEFSDHVFSLCKKHQYSSMLEYMDSPETFSLLETNTDFQIYYYYYGCGFFQVTKNELTTRHYLKMALSYTMPTDYVKSRTEVETLLVNALGLINHLMGDDQEAAKLFNLAIASIQENDSRTENLNVVHYQYGLFLRDQANYSHAIQVLLTGFDRTRAIESYFMLPEYALALVECYQKLNDNQNMKKFNTYHQVFKQLEDDLN